MSQLSFFGLAGQSNGLPKEYLDYRPDIFTPRESVVVMDKLITETPWTQPAITLYNKEMITPRLVAWYGDLNGDLPARRELHLIPWTKELEMIRARVERLSNINYNSVLLNYYRDGNDSVAWHSDKESAAQKKTVVASVSFGEVRAFDIRNKQDRAERYSIRLEDGSYLLMKAGFQDLWEHRIAKSARPIGPRLNLTFRVIV